MNVEQINRIVRPLLLFPPTRAEAPHNTEHYQTFVCKCKSSGSRSIYFTDDFPLSLWELWELWEPGWEEIADWKLFIILTSYLYRQYFDVHSLRSYQEDKICIVTWK